MDNLIDVKEQFFSFFGESSRIEGKLLLEGRTHICSSILGELIQQDKSPVIIEQAGNVQGTINCHDLYIHGTVSGEIIAKGTVKIYSSAYVDGKINAMNLTIEPGAEVNIEGHTLQE